MDEELVKAVLSLDDTDVKGAFVKAHLIKVRKKPIVVQAIRWWSYTDIKCNPTGYIDYSELIDGYHCDLSGSGPLFTAYIYTLEGRMAGQEGDWIIVGVNGERYFCKHDIFEKTYEEENGNQTG